jgi:hypothetical protein
MKLVSMRLPGAFVAGATFMAWRANFISPPSTAVENETLVWILAGGLLLVAIGLWEVVRSYQPTSNGSKVHVDG